jgi:hypothetical protein
MVPLEDRGVSAILIGDERRLQNNYNIYTLLLLHFQNLVTRVIRGRDIAIFERMLPAKLRFPFLDID